MENVRYKDDKISIAKNEILLMKLLLENKSRLLTSSEIYENDEDINGRNIVQILSRFKKKITQLINSDEFFIDNIYGSGYKIKIKS